MAVMSSGEKIRRLRKALAALVGSDNDDELKRMQAYMHVLPDSEAKTNALKGVKALIDTME